MKTTEHRIFYTKSQEMKGIENCSIDLVITSPPYPMIEMWDEIMANQNVDIKKHISTNPLLAFELMHQELDKVGNECMRVLKDGGFLCVNIGDATRTINNDFQLYNNHSRIIKHCTEIGFTNLPNIIWRKQTNAPNKFMGSGMLPCGAYVTLEHEWILIFRKGGKRIYKISNDKQNRRNSSFFWEERNVWFSDLWDLKGTKQKISKSKTRERSASFPLSIPYRIINMYSQMGDTILDPFLGLGTTTIAAMLSNRNSIGFEIDSLLKKSIVDNILSFSINEMNNIIYDRFQKHLEFIKEREQNNKEVKYYNSNLKCNVMTRQETDLTLHYLTSIEHDSAFSCFRCFYEEKSDIRQVPFVMNGTLF